MPRRRNSTIFARRFANYTRFMTDTLVNATGDLPVAQGRAQQCVKILQRA